MSLRPRAAGVKPLSPATSLAAASPGRAICGCAGNRRPRLCVPHPARTRAARKDTRAASQLTVGPRSVVLFDPTRVVRLAGVLKK